jgi:hypothetical protein
MKKIIYGLWMRIKDKCYAEKSKEYPKYGGKGIKMDPKWDDLDKFTADIGERPSKDHHFSRIDYSKDFNKDNCKWMTRKEIAVILIKNGSKPTGKKKITKPLDLIKDNSHLKNASEVYLKFIASRNK